MNSSTTPPPGGTRLPPEVVEGILGPILVGAFLSVWLYGALLLQCYIYFCSSGKDPRWRKAMVSFIVLIDTFSTFGDCYASYQQTVQNFGDYDKVFDSVPMFYATSISGGFTTLIIQMFFIWRIFALTKQRILSACLTTLAFASFAFVVYFTAASIKVTNWHSLETQQIAWSSVTALTDIAIATSLIVFLRKNRTGFVDTDHLFDKITISTIQTSLVPAIFAVISLILYFTEQNNGRFVVMISISNLYSNCLLSSLNSRLRNPLNPENHKTSLLTPPVRTSSVNSHSGPMMVDRDMENCSMHASRRIGFMRHYSGNGSVQVTEVVLPRPRSSRTSSPHPHGSGSGSGSAGGGGTSTSSYPPSPIEAPSPSSAGPLGGGGGPPRFGLPIHRDLKGYPIDAHGHNALESSLRKKKRKSSRRVTGTDLPTYLISPDRRRDSGRKPDDDGLSLRSDMLGSDEEEDEQLEKEKETVKEMRPVEDRMEIRLAVPMPSARRRSNAGETQSPPTPSPIAIVVEPDTSASESSYSHAGSRSQEDSVAKGGDAEPSGGESSSNLHS